MVVVDILVVFDSCCCCSNKAGQVSLQSNTKRLDPTLVLVSLDVSLCSL